MKGHILLVHYKKDPIALLIRLKTKSYWNHCAWIFDEDNLIESKRTGITFSPINTYDNKDLYDTKILKIKNLSNEDKFTINFCLWNSCRKNSSLEQIITFLLILIKWKGKFPKKTCSGLLEYGFNCIGRSFCSKNPDFTTPEDINISKEVENVNS